MEVIIPGKNEYWHEHRYKSRVRDWGDRYLRYLRSKLVCDHCGADPALDRRWEYPDIPRFFCGDDCAWYYFETHPFQAVGTEDV